MHRDAADQPQGNGNSACGPVLAPPAVTPSDASRPVTASRSRPRRLSPLLAVESLSPRLRDIAAMRGLGYKLHEIAAEFGCSPQAVSIMLDRHRRRLESLGPRAEHWQLSSRATSVLGRLGITTREQARARNVLRVLRGQRNCGVKTIAEIEQWLATEDVSAASV